MTSLALSVADADRRPFFDGPADEAEPHHDAVAAAIEYLVAQYPDRPSLDAVAAVAGMHPHHFQRVFKRWAGISPKRFLQHLTVEHAKQLLAGDESVLGAAIEVGLSGPSRLHDLFVACEAMTPGEYKARGRGLVIRYGIHPGPLGRMLIGLTERGVCWLSFVVAGDEAAAVAAFAADWPDARLVEDRAATAPIAARAFAGDGRLPLRLLLRGTNFELKVWQALLAIPTGSVVSYEDIATAIGQPTALRAVGRAIGHNPISLLIPCHRVIRKSGAIHNYRWGVGQKRALLAYDAARREEFAGQERPAEAWAYAK
jgi:AraC family transcriptional regulator of adaptative response/methylated-DNA-[protein]-cysteine methyltransferase